PLAHGAQCAVRLRAWASRGHFRCHHRPPDRAAGARRAPEHRHLALSAGPRLCRGPPSAGAVVRPRYNSRRHRMPIVRTKHDHTAILTLSRPNARNCWGQDYNDGLLRHLDELANDDSVRSVILTGDEAGAAFSAGANLRDPNTHNTRSAEA